MKILYLLVSGKVLLMASLVFFLAPFANAQDEGVLGVWLTEKSDKGASMAVEIFECGSKKVCGEAVDVFGTDKRDNVGLIMIKGMQKKSNSSFVKGRIYAPDTEKWYKSKMNLQKDGTLKVSGCVLGGIICRSQVWKRQ